MASLLPVPSFKSSFVCRRCALRLFHSTPRSQLPRARPSSLHYNFASRPSLPSSEHTKEQTPTSNPTRSNVDSRLNITPNESFPHVRKVIPHRDDPDESIGRIKREPGTVYARELKNMVPHLEKPPIIRTHASVVQHPPWTTPHTRKFKKIIPNEEPLSARPKPGAPRHESLKSSYSPVLSSDDFNYYWETIPPTIAQKVAADSFFVKKARPQFLRSVPRFRQFPEGDVPEVAFIGRSNVGKSSLLNALVNADIKDLLARTSPTPGFTKTMNLYGMGPLDGVRIKPGISGQHDRIIGVGGLLVVDMPGYGEGSLAEWGTEIMKYLTRRKQLRRVFVLIDAQHGIKDKDRDILATLRMTGVPHQVVLSKVDKVFVPQAKRIAHIDRKANSNKWLAPKGTVENLRKSMEKIKDEIRPARGGGALGELLAVSSEVMINGRRLGIDAVRAAVLRAAGINQGVMKNRKEFASEKWVE